MAAFSSSLAGDGDRCSSPQWLALAGLVVSSFCQERTSTWKIAIRHLGAGCLVLRHSTLNVEYPVSACFSTRWQPIEPEEIGVLQNWFVSLVHSKYEDPRGHPKKGVASWSVWSAYWCEALQFLFQALTFCAFAQSTGSLYGHQTSQKRYMWARHFAASISGGNRVP